MSWGIRVIILYCSFVVMMLTLVFLSMRQDFGLVSADYYEREINYQSEIDKKKNSASLKEKLLIYYDRVENKVRLSFPKELNPIQGDILFYRPSDSGKDVIIPISLNNENAQEVEAGKFDKGLWRVKVNWKSGGKEFLDETPLVIQ